MGVETSGYFFVQSFHIVGSEGGFQGDSFVDNTAQRPNI